MGEALFLFL